MANETRTTIANLALDILGKGPTGDIDNPKQEIEKRLAANLDAAIDKMLRLNKWPASRKTLFLPGATLNSDDTYAYEIQLPADCAAVWQVGDAECAWERRSGQGAGSVVSNVLPPVRVEYARRLAPAEMTEEMRAVAAVILADKVKQHAALSAARRDEVRRHYKETLIEATRVAGAEDGPDTPFGSPWLDSMAGA